MAEILEPIGHHAQTGPAIRVSQASSRIRTLLAIHDLAFHQEVLDFLERDPRVDVVGAVAQPEAFFRLERTANPSVTVTCPVLTREVQHPSSDGRPRTLLVVGEEMSVTMLRDAIDAGAKAVFAWPEERDDLARAIAATPADDESASSSRGRVVAVFGPRGGSGTTFLASHLAAALVEEGRRCVLVDLDASFADVSVALGVEPGEDTRTIADLLPVAGELGPDHVQDALFQHPRGFAALLAPPEPSVPQLPPGIYTGAVALLALAFEAVVLHTPRSLGQVARAGLALADEILLVVSPDLFSLYSARRAIGALGLRNGSERIRVVINPLVRGEVGVREIERVLGMRPKASVRFDPAVSRAQDRGELLSARSHRAWRDVRALARLQTLTDGNAGPTDGVTRS
ncbi:MAG TPA: AAA family ATPase [Actinomycetota bacterium]|nr:AAA family ATPase [Actinomycetota bacterium]